MLTVLLLVADVYWICHVRLTNIPGEMAIKGGVTRNSVFREEKTEERF